MRLIDPARVPSEVPVLPVRGTVVFPGTSPYLTLQADDAVSAARAAFSARGLVAVALRRTPGRDGVPFHETATLAAVVDLLGRTHVRCRVSGLARVALTALRPDGPHVAARVQLVEDAPGDAAGSDAVPRDRRLRDRLLADGPDAFPDLSLPELRALVQVRDRASLADLVLADLPIAAEDRQRGLAERSVEVRLALASSLLDRALADAAARRRLLDEVVRIVRLALWRAWRPRAA